MTSRTCKIGLGTVQWGIDYGVTNRAGMTPSGEVSRIISAAHAAGVTVIDTASLYGSAEEVLGRQELSGFRIVTKTPRYARDLITKSHADDLIKAFERSLDRLGVSSVYGLLAHHADDLLSPGGDRLIDAMCSLKRAGRVKRIGVSIYEGRQLTELIRRFTLDLVQLPISVLDQRLLTDGTISQLQSCGVEVHARSIFLQGLMLLAPGELPDYFLPWRNQLSTWHAACDEQGMSPLQAALTFVCDLSAINCCVIGVQSRQQFDDCIRDLDSLPPFDATGLGINDPALVNPSNWRVS